MRNSGKPYCFLAKKSKQKQARRKRLKIQRARMGNLTPANGDAMRNRRTSIKNTPASESSNASAKEGDIAADVRPVKTQLDSASGVPAIQFPESSYAAEGNLADESILRRVKDSESLNFVSYGIASVIGRRRVMDDAVAVGLGVGGRELSYFTVFDGDGGSTVAKACSNRLHKLLAKEIEGSCGGFDWGEIMRVCFKKMDEELTDCFSGGGGGGPARMTGSTAVVVVVGKEEVVVANYGDSKAIVSRGGVPVTLSHDHKSDRPDERMRGETARWRIVNSNRSRSHVFGVFASSRSTGDEDLKLNVVSEPEVTVNKRTKTDNFLIIASDGLWDVVSNELACDVVKMCLSCKIRRNKLTEEEGDAASVDAAAILAELAMAKGSKDNISVIVVELEKEFDPL